MLWAPLRHRGRARSDMVEDAYHRCARLFPALGGPARSCALRLWVSLESIVGPWSCGARRPASGGSGAGRAGKVTLRSVVGVERILDRLSGEQLPRICQEPVGLRPPGSLAKWLRHFMSVPEVTGAPADPTRRSLRAAPPRAVFNRRLEPARPFPCAGGSGSRRSRRPRSRPWGRPAGARGCSGCRRRGTPAASSRRA